MKKVWCKLIALQPALRQLNNKEFKYISQQIEKARYELSRIQEELYDQATNDLVEQEKEILMKLEKWSMIEESALRQKLRTRWIQLGDTNNKYFSVIIKERTQKKKIICITSLTGQILYEPQAIQNEFVQFYKGLMGSSVTTLPAIDVQVMKRGPTLSRQQRIDLCADITKEEITARLQSIGNDKAPGIDGFNAYFFKYTWKTIKEDIIDAVKSFFKIGKIYKPVNCTLVTLIPKVENPKTVKEYRPIACCTVLYKIISKVLAKRLHDVIQSVICDSQARFIPGRKISNNVLLAHELVKAYTRKNISPRNMLKIDLQKAYDLVEWD